MINLMSIRGRKCTGDPKQLVQEICLSGAKLVGNSEDVWENNPEQEQ